MRSGYSVHFQIWNVWLCLMKKTYKRGKNSYKQRGMVLIVGDDVWGAVSRIQCVLPNMEGVAMLNEK